MNWVRDKRSFNIKSVPMSTPCRQLVVFVTPKKRASVGIKGPHLPGVNIVQVEEWLNHSHRLTPRPLRTKTYAFLNRQRRSGNQYSAQQWVQFQQAMEWKDFLFCKIDYIPVNQARAMKEFKESYKNGAKSPLKGQAIIRPYVARVWHLLQVDEILNLFRG